MYAIAAAALALISLALPTALQALSVLLVGTGALGMGNGAVFQLVPQRFSREMGIMTGLVGMTGGVGGFYLASSLGVSKQLTGSYELGFLLFAGLALLALVAITALKRRWRTTWAAALGASRI
jgi:NNP family nitrate/nitrite transporter-like MFS transporter